MLIRILTSICKFYIDLIKDTFKQNKFLLFSMFLIILSLSAFILKEIQLACIVLIFLFFWKLYIKALNEKEEEYNKQKKMYWLTMSGWEFERETARILRKEGFRNVKVTKGSGDGGADIICYKKDLKCLIQCKNWVRPVTPLHVRATYAVKEDFDADVVILVASSGVTEDSLKFIKNRGDYLLWTLDDLIKMNNKRKR